MIRWVNIVGAQCNGTQLIWPFKSSRCMKALFYIPENRPDFPTTEGFYKENFHETFFQYFSWIMHPFQAIFIHYKPGIATTIRGLW